MKTVATAAGVVALLLIIFVPSIVCWLKGKKLWATVGFFIGWHWIPAFRLAKPRSWWARRYYGEDKMRRSRARFDDDDDPYEGREAPAEVRQEFSADDASRSDCRSTRRAQADG